MDLNSKEVRWCWENNLKVSMKSLDKFGNSLKMVVSNNGKIKEGKQIFLKRDIGNTKFPELDIYVQMFEFYKDSYNRNNKK